MQLLETFPNECPQRCREGYLLGKLDYTLYQERVPLPKEFKIKLDAEVNRGSLMTYSGYNYVLQLYYIFNT